ncbi:bifunctional DNA primase/polymerase [Cryptosporangium arvum]|uniref:Bifunctional DNA primase/polymerase family protein n=1 Tax=Cryptosporangium arvum DSM 44712 TaxID=927661 RepID=A0A011AD83_9ACTN|nr:bifunctional DNA primase/polymerase [Cryptosporangium arvum]EXG80016.1 bifunctional DNA primase/polymerase family protein [Cryptosporangium arvum DSM 44712]
MSPPMQRGAPRQAPLDETSCDQATDSEHEGTARPTARQLLEQALLYAAYGWFVFVLSADKVPLRNCPRCRAGAERHDPETCTCLTCHGFYAATRDPVRIAEMIARHPDGMLAVRTGAPSGLVVVDVDPRHSGHRSLGKLEQAVGLLPGTVQQLTGGGGLHMLYRHPGHHVKSRSNAFGSDITGVDVKADGGYIVVAPSVTRDGGRYEWLGGIWSHTLPLWPAILTPLLDDRPQLRAVLNPRRRTDVRASTAHATAALRGEVERVTGSQPGQRNDELNRAAYNLGQLVGAGQLDHDQVADALRDAALSIGPDEPKILRTIRSGMNAGMANPRPHREARPA